jgi:hypothetical protein
MYYYTILILIWCSMKQRNKQKTVHSFVSCYVRVLHNTPNMFTR